MHDLAQRWASEEPSQNQARDLLASALRKLGDVRKLFARDFPEARRSYERAIEIGREIVAAEPDNDAFRSHLALAVDDLGGVAKQQRQFGEARDLFGQAREMFATLVAEDPENLDWRILLLSARHHIALLDRDESRYPEARAAWVRIRDELSALSRDGRLEGRSGLFVDLHDLDALIDECSKALRKSG